MFNPEQPFNDLPLLPPQITLEIPSVLKACIEANKELARLKMAERLIPNQIPGKKEDKKKRHRQKLPQNEQLINPKLQRFVNPLANEFESGL